MKNKELTTYKVRCAATFACYAFIEAKDECDAERLAKRWFRAKNMNAETEASHIHEIYEVEEV